MNLLLRLAFFIISFFVYSISFSSNIEVNDNTSVISISGDANKLAIPVVQVSRLPVPKIAAKSWIVVDVNSEQVLSSYNPDVRLEPASLTKIMTAYLAFNALHDKRLDLEQSVVPSDKAWKTGGSRMFIEPKTRVSVHELLQGVIVQSGNDASIALAESVSGDEDSFVALMNQEAKYLGMNNSNFMNSTGLPETNHITTARDLSLLSVRMIKDHSSFLHYYKQKEFKYNNILQTNRNRLLWSDSSVDGLKTGYTDSAGYCLVATAIRGDRRMLVVLLGANSESTRTEESLKLLNWGFQNFDTVSISEQTDESQIKAKVWGGTVDKVNLGPIEKVWLTVPRSRLSDVKFIVERIDPLIAPLQKGQLVGNLQFIIDNNILKVVPIVSLQNVNKAGLVGISIDYMKRWIASKSLFR
ncbi:D-alanyl-D-alanine carboxypeptidase family protein [Candidatus Kinetoplastidibacterium crithidiae]|uniref:serine-type D-Ala-D-Ala carboxypeptidase n=1 Tax=Candidatus Kinetoplastidibacterium crithidiae TCC036E TaxID=1208918 RepID=M1M7A6_9PROT|nr:D-alanyl-D-alanine carboxypeptidase family protein [Candidatus Kinetoplastibacterium crithidii]AFZ82965.1 penicillin-binding protein precursor [Candidatus Kinetoplastibacterium crithidii (ex Angomonas deanei ATCC 30255)]AGF47965.1 penicillin-binding D-alanyl-D-alanine carboxypeptidase [Candidatus Kinetoplastibacterium crithidii TCC036E]